MKNKGLTISMISMMLFCIGWIIPDILSSPNVGDWLSLLLFEMGLQVIYNNFKKE